LQKRMQNRREIIFMPVLFIIILIIFSSILYSDYMRYKPIAYGNST
jgi:disulfide bond formation protein DsbB